jgi:hypothetical protein
MNKVAVTVLAMVVIVSGCGGQASSGNKQADEGPLPRSFFSRTVIYTIEPGAKEYMSKLENLVGQVQKLEPPLPDDVVLPVYRDADINRDHHISAKEAETFYKEYVLKFEDALGSVKY